MGSVNKVILLGNLGRDPELKYTPSGSAVANFSIATTESWKDKEGQKQEHTEWHRIVVWGKLAEICGEYLHKGRQVYIEGAIRSRTYKDKEGVEKTVTEIRADDMVMIGRGDGPAKGPSGQSGARGGSERTAEGAGEGEPTFTDDDIPF